MFSSYHDISSTHFTNLGTRAMTCCVCGKVVLVSSGRQCVECQSLLGYFDVALPLSQWDPSHATSWWINNSRLYSSKDLEVLFGPPAAGFGKNDHDMLSNHTALISRREKHTLPKHVAFRFIATEPEVKPTPKKEKDELHDLLFPD